MIKKEMIAMLLAGGQGSRLGVLTSKVAKPAVAFGGKYRIIDFMRRVRIVNGIQEQLMPFTRILSIWSSIILNMYLFFQVTIYTRWITR